MTLCLAGVCTSGEAIAFVFDDRLSTNTTSSDVLNKGARIAPGWALLLAGNHVAQAGSIYDRLKRQLREKPVGSLADVQTALVDVQSKVLLEEVIPPLLPPGMKYGEFRRDPSKVSDHIRIQAEIQQAREGCDFLLAGFDDRRLPHIVACYGNRAPENYSRWGYGAIGSGAMMAEHYLAFCQYRTDLEAREAVYHLCAAKFFAESGNVGPSTRIALLKKDNTRLTMDSEHVRQLWDREGRPRVPSGLRSKMPEWETGTPTSFGTLPKPSLENIETGPLPPKP